jgi:hypothetical protein
MWAQNPLFYFPIGIAKAELYLLSAPFSVFNSQCGVYILSFSYDFAPQETFFSTETSR